MRLSRSGSAVLGMLGSIFLLCFASAQSEGGGREDVVAAAPDDLTVDDLGRLFTRDFRPLVGATNSILPGDGTGVRTTSRTTTDRLLRIVASASELNANASAWGIGSASLTAAEATRHAYYRAYQVSEIRAVDDRLAIPAVPAGAEWYVSGIYVGRLLETHFWSRETAIGAGFEAQGIIGSGSISGFANAQSLQFHIRTLGLEPQGGDAVFASTPTEMRAAYAEVGQPVPILVRFSRVPRSSMPVASAEAPRQISLVSVSFPQRNPARGTAWDVLGGNPDILVRVQQGGTTLLDRFLAQDQLEWRGNVVIGDAIVVTPDAPLVFTFTDRDMASHDAAGSTIVTVLPGIGETSTLTATEGGVTIQLHAEPSP